MLIALLGIALSVVLGIVLTALGAQLALRFIERKPAVAALSAAVVVASAEESA